MRLVEVGGGIAHELEGVAALDQRQPFGREPLQLDRADFRSVLIAVAALLCLLVVVELAFDAVAGTVEEVHLTPEQVIEIRLEAGVGECRHQGVEDVGECAGDPVTR